MEIPKIILSLDFKDWLIVVSLVILVTCLIQIRRLKRIIVQEVRRRLVPEVVLELDVDERAILIKNQSTMFAKNINIEDIRLNLVDYGFTMGFLLKFDEIGSLKPNENLKLNFRLIKGEKDEIPKRELGRFIPHLVATGFKAKIHYSNLENLKFSCLLVKKVGKKKFYLIRIESTD
ncbi:MAG: hypothetical protein ABH954_00390 [Candidatus Omnitrophota bacterium]